MKRRRYKRSTAPTAAQLRDGARREILAAANRHRRDRNLRASWRLDGYMIALKPFTARHINQAVAVVRHNGLVADDVLVAAGFRPAGAAAAARRAA
ncbi:MAG TPA: hypothetical protein VFU14_20300 [Acidimicrobiales bacterium]|nr:hypothetical protein [Acidimicrobiales bacterium]